MAILNMQFPLWKAYGGWIKKPTEKVIGDKSKFYWKSMIRLPEFVTLEVFEHAKELLKVKNHT